MGTKKSKVNQSHKTRYKVVNWPEYDRALVARGDVTIWLTPAAIEAWKPEPAGARGRPREYSQVAIEAALGMRMVFGLPWRQTEGFLNAILQLMNLDLKAPDHTTLSRRTRVLELSIPKVPADEPHHVLLDATGLKVFGRGEWAVAKHGKDAVGTGWRKFHVAVDASGRILAADLTEAETPDAEVAPGLLNSTGGNIERVTTDGGYDRENVYEAVAKLGAEAVIPPRKDARTSDKPVMKQRNEHIAHRKRTGKRQWRKDTGQHQQARVENTFYRYKGAFGRKLRARTEEGQLTEVLAGCLALNRMYSLGRPISVPIKA